MAFLWVLWAFYFIQLSAAAQRELTEPQKRLTSTTAIICEEWERAMCCTSFFSRLLIFFCLHTGTRASTQHSLSWGAWQHSPLLANLMKPNKVICALSVPPLRWLLSWGKKEQGGDKTLEFGALLLLIPQPSCLGQTNWNCFLKSHSYYTEIIFWDSSPSTVLLPSFLKPSLHRFILFSPHISRCEWGNLTEPVKAKKAMKEEREETLHNYNGSNNGNMLAWKQLMQLVL